MVVPWLPGVAFLLLGLPALAQSWTQTGTTPLVTFGIAGQLLARDAVGLVGFDEAQGQTLLPSGGGWSATPAPIPPRLFSTMFTTNAGAYLFGGFDGAASNGVWFFDRNQGWVPRPTGPSPRYGAAAASLNAYAFVLFGGSDGTSLVPGTWSALDVGMLLWWPQTTTIHPAPRLGHAMATGPGQSAVLFGGDDGTQPLGDTWIFRGTSWTQHLGSGPPAAANCRMVYDPHRDITVLLHGNGDTWEWNDFAWRRVPAPAAGAWTQPSIDFDPAPGGGVRAFQPGLAGLEAWRFTPSPADFQITYDATCNATPGPGLELFAVQRSLPILGQPLHLRATGLLPTAWLVGVFELSTQPVVPMGCSCNQGVTGVGAGFVLVPGTGPSRDWFLPILPLPLLHGVPIDVQGFHVDAAAPCYVMGTQRGTLVPGW